jgi:hypothetical protein
MNAWETHHRRTALLTEVVADLDAGAPLPWNDALADAFVDRDGLLVALHGIFSRRALARVDLALELHDIPAASVAEAWHAVASELPGVVRVLAENADSAALAVPSAKLHRMVASAAGVASLDTSPAVAAAAGRAFVERSLRVVVPARRDGWLRERLSFRPIWKTA